jgi:hypothetical protein
MALEFQSVLRDKFHALSRKRLLVTVLAAGALYLAVTSGHQHRWTSGDAAVFLSGENPVHAPWLPETGGVFYSKDMALFYRTFFQNPHASWRYVLGFEPTMMPAEDLAVYRELALSFGAYSAYGPWVQKMTAGDRLIVEHPSSSTPKIEGLEWCHVAPGIWSGRLPRKKEQQ